MVEIEENVSIEGMLVFQGLDEKKIVENAKGGEGKKGKIEDEEQEEVVR